jgi:hypothetical protein
MRGEARAGGHGECDDEDDDATDHRVPAARAIASA